MAIEFNPIVWRDGEAPDISADNLNRYEAVIPTIIELLNSVKSKQEKDADLLHWRSNEVDFRRIGNVVTVTYAGSFNFAQGDNTLVSNIPDEYLPSENSIIYFDANTSTGQSLRGSISNSSKSLRGYNYGSSSISNVTIGVSYVTDKPYPETTETN